MTLADKVPYAMRAGVGMARRGVSAGELPDDSIAEVWVVNGAMLSFVWAISTPIKDVDR